MPSIVERWIPGPVDFVASGLEVLHYGAGLPWWLVIAGSSVAVRFAIFPVLLYHMQQVVKVSNTGSAIGKLIEDFSIYIGQTKTAEEKKVARGWFMNTFREIKQQEDLKFRRFLYYPMALGCTILPFVFAARKLVFKADHDLEQGGLWWFENLTQPDPHSILPLVGIGVTYAVLAWGLGRAGDGTKGAFGATPGVVNKLVTGIQVFELMLIPMVVDLPTGIFVYWIPSAGCGLVQKILLGNRYIAASFGLPHPALEQETPDYSDIVVKASAAHEPCRLALEADAKNEVKKEERRRKEERKREQKKRALEENPPEPAPERKKAMGKRPGQREAKAV